MMRIKIHLSQLWDKLKISESLKAGRAITCDLFLEGPENFSHPKSHSKISNLMITELFNSMILLISTEVYFIQSFRTIHFTVLKIQITKNAFAGPKSFQGF